MADVYIDASPQAGRAITEIHAWIATYPDGGQGIHQCDLPVPPEFGAARHIPLLSSKRAAAESFAPVARTAQRLAMHKANRMVKIELRTFRLVEEPSGLIPRRRPRATLARPTIPVRTWRC